MRLDDCIVAGTPVVFVDGDCALCHRWAVALLRRDRSESLLVATLQSPLGRQACERVGQDPNEPHTALLLARGAFFAKSTAILRMGRYLSPAVAAIAAVALWCPRCLRDGVYDAVARSRRGLNRRLVCQPPPPELRSRFLE